MKSLGGGRVLIKKSLSIPSAALASRSSPGRGFQPEFYIKPTLQRDLSNRSLLGMACARDLLRQQSISKYDWRLELLFRQLHFVPYRACDQCLRRTQQSCCTEG